MISMTRLLLVCGVAFAWASAASANCEADYNGDGAVDQTDVQIFQSVLGTQDGDSDYFPAADHDGDGRVSALDYAYVLACLP